jgi:hypothetical protein
VSGNQLLDFLQQLRIAPADFSKIRFALLLMNGERSMKQLFDFAQRSGVISNSRRSTLRLKSIEEPSARELPLAFDRRSRNPKHFCDFLRGQASEKFEFDDMAFARIQFSQFPECFINRNDINFRLFQTVSKAESHPRCISAALARGAVARVVYQHAPHHVRGQSKELGAILPIDTVLIDQPEVRLVHQRGRLECVIGSFAAHVGSRQPSKFVVNQGQNLIQRIVIPVSDIDQQLGQALGIRFLHAGILPEYQGIHSSW